MKMSNYALLSFLIQFDTRWHDYKASECIKDLEYILDVLINYFIAGKLKI